MPEGTGAELSAFQFNALNQHTYWAWGDNYYGIGNATTLIDKLNDPKTTVSDGIRKRVRGEAEFLRAYFISPLYNFSETFHLSNRQASIQE